MNRYHGDRRMLKPAEVAKRLNCSIANVYALIGRGELRAVPVGAGGKGYRVSEADLNAFLNQRTAEVKQERKTQPHTHRKLKYLQL